MGSDQPFFDHPGLRRVAIEGWQQTQHRHKGYFNGLYSNTNLYGEKVTISRVALLLVNKEQTSSNNRSVGFVVIYLP